MPRFDPSTLSGAVALALRRELLHLWAEEEPGTSLDSGAVDAVVQALAPALAGRLAEVANAQIPALTVTADSPLPPVGGRPATGGTAREAAEHVAVLEVLQSFLSSHDLLAEEAESRAFLEREVSPRLGPAHPWQRWVRGGCALVLPAESVLCLSAVTAPALLAGRWCRPQEGDGDDWAEEDSPPAGTPQGLVRALRCRRRVFALERELVVREHAEQEREAFDRAERARTEARLMEVNRHLEERLKARTEELRRAGQKIIEAQRGIDDATNQLGQKSKQILRLEYRLGQQEKLIEQASDRSKEQNKHSLRLACQENLLRERETLRMQRLSEALGDKRTALIVQGDCEMTPGMIDQLEREFEARMQTHQKHFARKHREFERRVEEKRAEYETMCRELQALQRRGPASEEPLGRQSPPGSPRHGDDRSPGNVSEPPGSRLQGVKVGDTPFDGGRPVAFDQCSKSELPDFSSGIIEEEVEEDQDGGAGGPRSPIDTAEATAPNSEEHTWTPLAADAVLTASASSPAGDPAEPVPAADVELAEEAAEGESEAPDVEVVAPEPTPSLLTSPALAEGSSEC